MARLVMLGSGVVLLVVVVRYAVLLVLFADQYLRLWAGGCG